MVLENLINLRHVASAACQDDAAHQLVREFRRNLEPGILYDFLNTSLYYLDELLALYASVLIYRIE